MKNDDNFNQKPLGENYPTFSIDNQSKKPQNYSELLRSKRDQSKALDFPEIDLDMFESAIDDFTPFDNIPLLFDVSIAYLDSFCEAVYHKSFADTYRVLSGFSDTIMRKAIKGLAKSGNPTALSLAAKHFMKLDDTAQKDNINIVFVNDLNDND